MRILNISAQKPDSTGSGVYLAEMVCCELSAGHAAAVVAGVDASDEPTLPEGAAVFRALQHRDAAVQRVRHVRCDAVFRGEIDWTDPSTSVNHAVVPQIFLWGFWAIAYAVAFFVSAMHSRTKTSACRVIASVCIPRALH